MCGTNPTITELKLIDFSCEAGDEQKDADPMNVISPKELKQRMDNGENFVLVDVREPHEAEICSIKANKSVRDGSNFSKTGII